MKQWWFLFALIFFVSCGVSCNDNEKNGSSKDDGNGENGNSAFLSVVNWNVQTFFDAETEGDEYSEFKSSARWSRDKYIVRLQRLCQVISTLNADVFVFEEIENEGVLYDIANQLAGKSWDAKKLWTYGCFCKEDGASIGCAVLSRFPLSDLKTHGMDLRIQKSSQPSVRPMLEVCVNVEESVLKLFVCHWKSKSGGEEESEIWRDWQEFLVAEKIYEEENAVLVCGDLNRDIQEFVISCDGVNKSPNVIFRGSQDVKLYSPWLHSDGDLATEIGSYYFNEQWERIDNFFTFGDLKITSFSPKAEEPWADEKKKPVSYKIYTGEGYSDHLPIMCTLRIENCGKTN